MCSYPFLQEVELNSSPFPLAFEGELGLVTHTLRIREMSNFTVENPSKHCPNQVMTVSTKIVVMEIMLTPMGHDKKGTPRFCFFSKSL